MTHAIFGSKVFQMESMYDKHRDIAWNTPLPMSQKEFCRFSHFIESETGIKMPASKKKMLEGRLYKRLRALKMEGFDEYAQYLFKFKGMSAERTHIINEVTTNKTDFFREPGHFKILYDTILPSWLYQRSNHKPLFMWSAGCSTGKEPYTLAMVMEEFKGEHPDFDYQILATDISTRVLEIAKRGIYSEQSIEEIPIHIRKRYIMHSKDKTKKTFRIVPELRKKITFTELNFMENFNLSQKVDIIFCRNVVIYFEREVQEKLFGKFSVQLSPHGHLFIGHSETLNGMQVPFRQCSPTVYQKIST